MNTKTSTLIAILALMMAACGGGGGGSGGGDGGGSDPGSGDPAEPTTAFDDSHIAQVAGENVEQDSDAGLGVIVAALDSGVRATHVEFGDRVGTGFDATANNSASATASATPSSAQDDEANHGTPVASFIAGTNLGLGSQIEIAPVRIYRTGDITTEDIVEGFDHLLGRDDVGVVNASFTLGFLGNSTSSEVRARVVDGLENKDWVLVISANNTSTENKDLSFAARYADDPDFLGKILVVGAVDSNDNIASFSNQPTTSQDEWGDVQGLVEHYVTAPGSSVCGALGDTDDARSEACTSVSGDDAPTGTDESYAQVSGTSFSTPIVAGLVAVIRSEYPEFTADQIVDIVLDSADDLGDPGYDETFGAGRINAEAALQLAMQRAGATASSVRTSQMSSQRTYSAGVFALEPNEDITQEGLPEGAIWVREGRYMVPSGEPDEDGCVAYTPFTESGMSTNQVYWQNARGEFTATREGCLPVK